MSANLWAALGIVCGGGAVGGAVNAFVAGQGFGLPGIERTSAGARIWKPGGLGTVLVGAFAAGANWGLYGHSAPTSSLVTRPPLRQWVLPLLPSSLAPWLDSLAQDG
jgi:hypothetical protein